MTFPSWSMGFPLQIHAEKEVTSQTAETFLCGQAWRLFHLHSASLLPTQVQLAHQALQPSAGNTRFALNLLFVMYVALWLTFTFKRQLCFISLFSITGNVSTAKPAVQTSERQYKQTYSYLSSKLKANLITSLIRWSIQSKLLASWASA